MIYIIVVLGNGNVTSAPNPTAYTCKASAMAKAQQWSQESPGKEYLVMRADTSFTARTTYSTTVTEKEYK